MDLRREILNLADETTLRKLAKSSASTYTATEAINALLSNPSGTLLNHLPRNVLTKFMRSKQIEIKSNDNIQILAAKVQIFIQASDNPLPLDKNVPTDMSELAKKLEDTKQHVEQLHEKLLSLANEQDAQANKYQTVANDLQTMADKHQTPEPQGLASMYKIWANELHTLANKMRALTNNQVSSQTGNMSGSVLEKDAVQKGDEGSEKKLKEERIDKQD